MNNLPPCVVEYRYTFVDDNNARRYKKLAGRELEVFIVNSPKKSRVILAIKLATK